MLASSTRPRAVGSVPHYAMSTPTSLQAAELNTQKQSGGNGPASPLSSRPESSSSKPASTVDNIDFRFLNFSHPKDAKNAQTRRNVRSHVTSKQHERQRRVAAENAWRNQQSSSSAAPSPPEADTSSPENTSPASPAPSPPVRINPLDVYPEEWHPYLRPVMDFYMNIMSIDLPETDATSRELLRTTNMSIILADKASLHALMLAAGAHYNKMRPQQPHRIDLLQLRGMAIQEINSALTDHSPGGRATSDQLIAAVGKMATYELLFGQREIFHTHMTGLQRMVSLRGGLQALGGGGLLERILLWIDINAAQILPGALYFPPEAFSSYSGHPRPNRQLFLMGLQGRAQS